VMALAGDGPGMAAQQGPLPRGGGVCRINVARTQLCWQAGGAAGGEKIACDPVDTIWELAYILWFPRNGRAKFVSQPVPLPAPFPQGQRPAEKGRDRSNH